MGIQDLGAIGEFISSLVIVVTLLVLIYEVRGTKQATLQSNAQERQRKRDDLTRSLAGSSDLASIVVAANKHLGSSFDDYAAEYGLQADQFMRLFAQYSRQFTQLRDAFESDLPDKELELVDLQIGLLFDQPAFAKWYDVIPPAQRKGEFARFYGHVDEIRARMQAA
jgi:hypothetical protein